MIISSIPKTFMFRTNNNPVLPKNLHNTVNKIIGKYNNHFIQFRKIENTINFKSVMISVLNLELLLH